MACVRWRLRACACAGVCVRVSDTCDRPSRISSNLPFSPIPMDRITGCSRRTSEPTASLPIRGHHSDTRAREHTGTLTYSHPRARARPSLRRAHVVVKHQQGHQQQQQHCARSPTATAFHASPLVVSPRALCAKMSVNVSVKQPPRLDACVGR